MQGDAVNHPAHYAEGWSNGAEIIDITENLNFNRGNVVKYTARAGRKDPDKELEDLEKAEFYLKREIARLKAGLRAKGDADAAAEARADRLRRENESRQAVARSLARLCDPGLLS